jgi:regulator of protease activity HflC (stomatin/prohibitin superfamily)
VLEAVAFRTLTDYAAGVNIDQIIGPGRAEFEEGLRQAIQERIDGMGLGIDLVFLGLQGCHPPFESEVAATFQRVVSAESIKDATVEAARGEAQQIKSRVAGSAERADTLDEAIREMNRLSASPDATAEQLAGAEQRVEDLLTGNPTTGIDAISGEASALIARAEASRTIAVARADSRRRLFENELRAYQAAPRLYKVRKYLDMWTKVTPDIRKFVILSDPEETDLIIILEGQKETVLDLSEPDE